MDSERDAAPYQLEALKKEVSNKLKDYKYCAAVSFDISGAFDVLNWFKASDIINDLPIFNYLISI